MTATLIWLRSRARFYRRARLSFHFALTERLALVVRLLAFGQRQLHLHPPILEIELERHEREPLLRHLADHLANLIAMQQQLPLPQLTVGGRAAMTIRTDVDVEHPHLAVVDPRVAVAEVDPPLADRLHLRAKQRHARFPGVEDVIVVAGLAVLGDRSLRFLAIGLRASHACTIPV